MYDIVEFRHFKYFLESVMNFIHGVNFFSAAEMPSGNMEGWEKGMGMVTVHSNQSGDEKDETVQQLLSVEDPANPTEIVIHVNMLKEGWDVTNLYTIVPLRAANSRTLVEQSIGRGLRLPYGKRTGVAAVDLLTIVSHDKFQEIVDHANDPNSIIKTGVVIGRDIPDMPTQAVPIAPTILSVLRLAPHAGAASGNDCADDGAAVALQNKTRAAGELRKICADSNCLIHHPKKQKPTADAHWKAEQEKQRREEALAQTTGLRVLNAIGGAVPFRLMKRDLLFVVDRLAAMLDERKLAILIRLHDIGKLKGADGPAKLMADFIHKTDEGTLGRLLVEMAILSTPSQIQTAKV